MGDDGPVEWFEVTCPHCDTEVRVGGYYESHCSCGYRWTVSVVAHGEMPTK